MTRIITGTADVVSGSPNVVVNGLVLSAINCPVDSAIVLDGATYYVLSLTDTTHVVLTRNYSGTSASGVPCEVSALTPAEIQTATTNQRLAAFLAQQALSPQGIPLFCDRSGTSDVDPGAGFVRFNDGTMPTILYISKTNSKGQDISLRLGTLDDSVNAVSRAVIQFVPADGSTTFLEFDVIGPITDASTYVKIPVALRIGSLPADRAQIAMTGVPSGKDGILGTPQGDYAGGTTYSADDIVQDQSASWIYINASSGSGHAPPTLPTTSNAYWQLVASGVTVSDVLAALGVPAIIISTSDPSGSAAENSLWFKVPA